MKDTETALKLETVDSTGKPWFLRFKTTVYALIAFIVIVGAVSYRSLPLEAAPEVKIPINFISTVYPGVSPEDMERLVTNVLEKERKDLKDFKSMTLIQKHRAIEEVLDREVRKMLLADGGNVEVVDMKEQDSGTDIYISYTGACASCPSGKTMTLEAITSTLQDLVDRDIRVHPL